MQVETIADQLFFTTCYIQAKSKDSSWVGTGFIYAVDTTVGTAHFLVTNKHVLEAAQELTVRMIKKDNQDGPSLGNATQITVQKLNAGSWVGHPEPSVDVAVMPYGQVLEQMQKINAPAFFRSVSPNMCLTASREQELDAVEEVAFIGYPNGLYDIKNYLPILRTGTTATPIVVDYQGNPAFLIDASVFPGSSGSPVFILNRGMFTNRKGSTIVGSRVICLGVLAAVHTRQLQGAVESLPARLVASFNEPMGLGIVYKARCIDDCVQLILRQSGLTQTQTNKLIETSTEPSPADDAVNVENDVTP